MIFFADVDDIDLYSVNWNIHYNRNAYCRLNQTEQ